jgi:RNA polymerase sigma-70 factor, ECF subfamily
MNTCTTQTRSFHQFDADYLQKLKNRSSETTGHFVEYSSAIVSRTLRRYGISPGSVDDLCQETLLRVLAGLYGEHQLRNPGSLGAFVAAVGKNVYREFCRAGRRTEGVPKEDRFQDTAPDPERCAMNGEVRQQIRDALNRLSPLDRQILVLAIAEGCPRPEICRRLNVTPANLSVILHRAKARFRNVIAPGAASWRRDSVFRASRGSAQGATA